eukprot:scaffold5887_cov122-Cylindrotheca_fusiformis.AAC.14
MATGRYHEDISASPSLDGGNGSITSLAASEQNNTTEFGNSAGADLNCIQAVSEDNMEAETPEVVLCWRRHSTRPFSSRSFRHKLLEHRFPLLKNDEGALVHFGEEWTAFMYCGRRLGREAIPGSDGQCGPANGPNCKSCNRLQSTSQLKILKLWFPSLSQKLLIAALRARAGNAYAAGSYLSKELQVPAVFPLIAFPGTSRRSEGVHPVSESDARRVVEVLNHSISRETAEMALRRNERNPELAIDYLLETSREEALAATVEEAARIKEFEKSQKQLQRKRLKVMLKTAMDDSLSSEARQLEESVVRIDSDKSLSNARSHGHGMVPAGTGEGVVNCAVCTLPIGSPYAGNHFCQQCQLCDGCIQASVVYMCPKMGNGGHVHACPLQSMKIGKDRKTFLCDIEGEGCLRGENHFLSYYCRDCNFDVCAVCMSKPAPAYYHRRLGKLYDAQPPECSEESLDDEYEEPTVGEPIATSTSTPSAKEKEEDGHGPTYDLYERMAASRNVMKTSRKSQGRKQSSEECKAYSLRHNRPQTLLKPRFASALESFIDGKPHAASEVHHVEDLLHMAQGAGNSVIKTDVICQAVESGKIGVAWTYLLAHSYGPKRKRDTCMKCFCGDAIDDKTAPNGAVGCINGHGMHPSCAADQLLSGGTCPTCRVSLHFPKIPRAEATAAEDFLETELQRRRNEEKEAIESQEHVLDLNDIVEISSDIEFCKRELMACPEKTGWVSEMEYVCGAMGRITNIEDGKVEVQTQSLPHCYISPDAMLGCNNCRMRPKTTRESRDNGGTTTVGDLCAFCYECPSCCATAGLLCPKSARKLQWTPSTLSLVGRASSAALWGKSLVDKDFAQAAAAEQHIIRLRAELNAITSARANLQEELTSFSHVSENFEALAGLKDEISAPDVCRAKHLLELMDRWDSTIASTTAEKKKVSDIIREGDIDSAARRIRHFNADLTAKSAIWRNAACEQNEYVIHDYAQVDLLAWPAFDAPKTGYCLKPTTRFWSKSEQLDSEGNVWLQVDSTRFANSDFQFGTRVTPSSSDNCFNRKLIGCRVAFSLPSNEIGIIKKANCAALYISWQFSGESGWYHHSSHQFYFANTPSPQGWLCMTPKQLCIARQCRNGLPCFGCGDALFPEYLHSQDVIVSLTESDPVAIGDSLLVAATLEPVEVRGIEDDFVLCTFPSAPAIGCVPISYHRNNLLKPITKASKKTDSIMFDERWTSRRELVMRLGVSKAKDIWERTNGPSETDVGSIFASCVKGHLLHARCFQEALLGGQCCPVPGCHEPLWVPQVRRLRRDEETCCRNEGKDADDEASDFELGGGEAVARARQDHGNVSYPISQELKMCPTCCSGPLFNSNCNDMQAHHGQCAHGALGEGDSCSFYVDFNEIAACLLQLSGDKKVADVLPKCPEHKCVIMFSGCMACGHLFTDMSWSELPKWDATAKTMLNLEKQKRKAATSLVSEITREAALLAYEREVLADETVHHETTSFNDTSFPSVPPPATMFFDGDYSDSDDSDYSYDD